MHHPDLVIVPTSFCVSSLYDGQAKILLERGYSVHVLDPPSFPASYKVGKPGPSMYDDAKFIGDFVSKLVDDGKDVIILAHSYGACPATQALLGLTKKERAAMGKKGGVVRIAYLTGVVPKLGENTVTTLAASGSGGPPQVNTDQYGWMFLADPEQASEKVFNNLPKEQAIAWSKFFGPHSGPAFLDPLTHPGYKDYQLPVSWYFCQDDLSVEPEIQQNAIDMIEQTCGKKVDVTKNSCDHMPLFSASDHFDAWTDRILALGGTE